MLNRRNCQRHSHILITLSMVIVFLVTVGMATSVTHAQSCQPRGPITFTFTPQFLGDSQTVGVSLSPCETVTLTETHSLGTDGNRGTNVKMTYSNGSGQSLRSEQFWGFFSGGYSFPASSTMPNPWVGTVSPNWTVASLKVESVGAYGKGSSNQAPEYNFTLQFATRPGYNTAGDSFATAANATLPSTYMGSYYDSTDTPSDPGQFFKVRLKCRQAMYVYGTARGSTQVGASFRIDIYDANQTLLTTFGWINIAAYGTKTFNSNPFTNTGTTEADFYIRLKSTNWAVHDFTLNIDEYIASNSSTNPRLTAPDATGSGGSVTAEEYRLPAAVDADVLLGLKTEVWGKFYRPTDFSGGPYPLVVFLHGNHNTCGRGVNPRIDDNFEYTEFGTCPEAPLLSPAPFIHGSPPPATRRNNFTGWVGMKITVGSQAIVLKQLGRMFTSGTAGNHVVKVLRVSDLAQVASATVQQINPLETISYATISPVTLSANTEYYVVSQETNGGDHWYDSPVIPSIKVASSVASITGSAISSDGTNWTVSTSPAGQVHGPVDFAYDFTNASGYSVVPNHLGYEYMANQLASRGYIVASINTNRGINGPISGPSDDTGHIFSRGRMVLKHLEKLKQWTNGPGAFIEQTTLPLPGGASAAWYGMSITVGAQPLTVHSLGRMFANGNTGTHTVQIVRQSDGVQVGSVSIPMTGGTVGSFKYENLASPVTLAANTTYYVASQEGSGDLWYPLETEVESSDLATVNGRVKSTDGTTWDTSGGTEDFIFGPVDFKFTVLSVDLAGKIDFGNVGLMGHSRGGQGVRAAYNLYRNPNIDPRSVIQWSSKIPGLSIKGIFEIAPTDNGLAVPGGGGVQYLNADGTAWNVLLPMCDADVFPLSGIRVFDRLMAFTGNNSPIPADNPAKQKSTYALWGTNHNFFNTEWQQRDQLFADPNVSACAGPNHNPIFPDPPTDGSGSANQQAAASATLLAFFRANVGASPSTDFNQNFNPLFTVSTAVSSVTQSERGFTKSPASTVTKVLFDFLNPLPTGSSYDTVNTNFSYDTIPEHDYGVWLGETPPSPAALLQKVGNVTWQNATDCNTYFQANWKPLSSGESIGGYKTLDFRIARNINTINGADPTNFQVVLIKSDGNPTGAALSLKKYLNLLGPVGVNVQLNTPTEVLHSILQTVRIPLTDFNAPSLSSIRGVRFVFSDTSSGDIFLANIRLSNVN